MSTPLVVFLHSSAYDRVCQAVNLLLTASSMERKCFLFLFYHALASYVAGGWDDALVSGVEEGGPWAKTLQKAFELANTPSLYKILEMAKDEKGGVTVCACSTSVKMLGLEPAQVKQKVDEIVGLATMLDISSQGAQTFYI